MAITNLLTFPAEVFHPVHGARTVTDPNDLAKLGPDWFETAELADMHRTWTEAKVTMHHNQAVKAAEAAGLEIVHPEPGTPDAPQGVVRNSVAATESHNAGNPEPL